MKYYKLFCIAFLLMEVLLYYLIMTTHGKLLVWSEYISIIFCFLFALISFQKPLMILGLALTVCADFFLVICDPIEQLLGMVFFLGAQIFYAVFLHRQGISKNFLIARIAVSIAVEMVTMAILGQKVDPLALVSVLYYVNLIMNMVCAFSQYPREKHLPIGFLLFILCDTVIGLQVAAGSYLPILEGSFIYDLIFSGFHLSWFFYLPSQVLIAFSARRK